MLPGDAALEVELSSLGVPPKQKARVQQVFQRSAEQAVHFTYGKGWLIPGGVSETITSEGSSTNGAQQTPPLAIIEPHLR
jgi:hypothetical protein